MKLNKVAMAVALTAALGSMSALADTTNGQIELQGELPAVFCRCVSGLIMPTAHCSWGALAACTASSLRPGCGLPLSVGSRCGR